MTNTHLKNKLIFNCLKEWLINFKEHLKLSGFKEIISIRASMNLGLTEALIKALPEITPYPRPVVKDEKLINPY